mgnify:FL=1|jgi:integrase
MSISYLPEVESQINKYFNSQNTMALADSTKALYNAVIRKKLLPFCKEQRIDNLNEKFTDHMDGFGGFLRDKKVSAHTIQSYLTITKLLFTYHGHHIKHTYKIPRQDKQAFDLKHEKRWFSGEDIAKCKTYIFKINHIRNHLLVRLMCETGARINEIANICVGDIKFKEKAILLSWSKTTPRPVFFTPETAIYLDKHLEASFPDPEKDSFKKVFPGKNMIYKIIDSMLKDLGIKTKGDGRGPHTFRHYVATNLRYNFRMDLDHVARLLGDTQKTISSRYLHPTAEMLHNLINRASGW